MKKHTIIYFFIILACIMIAGCSAINKTQNESSYVVTIDSDLICEESVSPNEKYIDSENDKVLYEVQVYQDKNNTIIVNASSNSAFFDDMQYTIEYDEKISKSDVIITWLTLMGSKEATEENQIAIADISISLDGNVFNEQKINFGKKAIEIVVDTIDKNKK
ncbi:hypothetical protein ACTNDY_00040 [Tissierellaceae bacterium HCP3S3_D8]